MINFNYLHRAEFPELTSLTDFQASFRPLYTSENYAHFDELPPSIGQAVVRADNLQPLGLVGNRYKIAQNIDLYNMLTKAARETLPANSLKGAQLKEVASYGGAYTRFELSFPELVVPIHQLGSETELKFRVGISNSFDGSGAVRVFAGAYDQVCENGMCIGDLVKQYARHTAGFTPHKFASFLSIEMDKYLTRARELQRWAKKEIAPDQARTALEDAGLSERKTNTMMDQFYTEAAARGCTVWALYSALTFYSSHNSARFGVRNSARVDNQAAALDQREREVSKIVNSKAWTSLIGEAA